MIATDFLPLFISIEKPNLKNDLTNASYALKLIRLISCAGPTISFKIFTRYKLNEKILNYLTADKYLCDPSLSSEVLRNV